MGVVSEPALQGRHRIEKIFPRLCETDTTENVLAMLKNECGSLIGA